MQLLFFLYVQGCGSEGAQYRAVGTRRHTETCPLPGWNLVWCSLTSKICLFEERPDCRSPSRDYDYMRGVYSTAAETAGTGQRIYSKQKGTRAVDGRNWAIRQGEVIANVSGVILPVFEIKC